MVDTYKVECVHKNQKCNAIFDCDFDSMMMRASINDIKFCFNVDDFFSGFNKIREKLGDEYLFLCNGARENVRMSAMGQSAGGIQVYLLNLIARSTTSDLCNIFDKADINDVTNLSKQREYNELWISYLMNGRLK